MPKDKDARKMRIVRHRRVRNKVSGTLERPRLCVFRSLRGIHAQLIDDTVGRTLAYASSAEAPRGNGSAAQTKTQVSQTVGRLLAERAQEKGITQAVFDRGGYKYHGRVKALAEAAREGGLNF